MEICSGSSPVWTRLMALALATRAAELFPKSWEGIVLTSGVVAGPMTYDFRLDLRAIYQF